MKKSVLLLITALMLSSGNVYAGLDDRINWSGFATAAYSISDSPDSYVERIDEEGSWEDTRIGLNFSADISGDLTMAGQILMAGREDSFNAHADWLFARYKFSENTSILFGKLKYPNLLFSEFYDAGYIYPWASAPQELYNLEAGGSGALYESIHGASFLFSVMPNDVEYVVQPYFGEADMEDGTLKNMFGFMFNANGENFQVKMGYNTGEFHPGGGHGGGGEEEAGSFHDFDDVTPDKTTWSIGGTNELGNLVSYYEYATVEYDGFSGLDTDAGYVTLGYRFNKFLPHITFASFEQNNGREQESITLGLRYELAGQAALKFGWSVIDATPPLEDDGEGWHEIEAHGLFFDGREESGKVNVLTITLDMLF